MHSTLFLQSNVSSTSTYTRVLAPTSRLRQDKSRPMISPWHAYGVDITGLRSNWCKISELLRNWGPLTMTWNWTGTIDLGDLITLVELGPDDSLLVRPYSVQD